MALYLTLITSYHSESNSIRSTNNMPLYSLEFNNNYNDDDDVQLFCACMHAK